MGLFFNTVSVPVPPHPEAFPPRAATNDLYSWCIFGLRKRNENCSSSPRVCRREEGDYFSRCVLWLWECVVSLNKGKKLSLFFGRDRAQCLIQLFPVLQACIRITSYDAYKGQTKSWLRSSTVLWACCSVLSSLYFSVFKSHPFPGLGLPQRGPAPSFGKVTGSAAPRGPDRPAPQPHPQDLDCLVQRAEHIPAGTRTPVCKKCNNVIR